MFIFEMPLWFFVVLLLLLLLLLCYYYMQVVFNLIGSTDFLCSQSRLRYNSVDESILFFVFLK
jgi:hypothetical protein